MARSVETILISMDNEQAAQTSLTTLNSTSQTSIYKLWKYITAVIMNLHEQLWDIFKADIELQISQAAVGSDLWLQAQVLKFQYDTIVPQVVVLTNFAPAYTVVNPAYQIITRASVKTAPNKTVSVKVAKSDPPVALSAPELSSLQTYLTAQGYGVGFAGVNIVASSLTSDKLFLEGTIKYDGQYSSVISANVIAAINDYLANITFDGIFKTLTLIDYIQAVQGVTDVQITNLALRADATLFINKTYLVQASTTLYTSYPLYAGYVIEETTGGETFTNKLTFTPTS